MWREIARFGRPVFAANLINRATNEVPVVAVGRILGAATLGQLSYAIRVGTQPVAAMVEVETGTQREFLAREWALAPTQERGQPRLRMKDLRSTLVAAQHDQLARVAPQSVCDLFAEAISDPCDKGLVALDGVEIRVGGREAKGVKCAVEHRQILGQLRLSC